MLRLLILLPLHSGILNALKHDTEVKIEWLLHKMKKDELMPDNSETHNLIKIYGEL